MSKKIYNIFCTKCKKIFRVRAETGEELDRTHLDCSEAPLTALLVNKRILRTKRTYEHRKHTDFEPDDGIVGCDCFSIRQIFNIPNHLKWCQTLQA